MTLEGSGRRQSSLLGRWTFDKTEVSARVECYVRSVLMLARWLDGVSVVVVVLFACRLTCPTSPIRLLSMIGNFLAL